MLDEVTPAGGSEKLTLATIDKALSEVPEHLNVFAVLGLNGDTKHVWDKTKPVEVKAAKELFERMRKEGYLAFSVKAENGEKNLQLHEFDPNAQQVIFTPQMQGG